MLTHLSAYWAPSESSGSTIYFNETPDELASMLTQNLETALACEFSELNVALARYEYNAEDAVSELTQALADLAEERRAEIKAEFFAREGEKAEFATGELSSDVIEAACSLLGVADSDRWTFEKASSGIEELCEAGDGELVYIIDLNDASGSPRRGFELLETLRRSKSEGTAFILTHETDTSGEAALESELLGELENDDSFGPPVCVISKERAACRGR